MILADALMQFSILWSNEIPLREKGTLLNLPRSLCVASLLSWSLNFFLFQLCVSAISEIAAHLRR